MLIFEEFIDFCERIFDASKDDESVYSKIYDLIYERYKQLDIKELELHNGAPEKIKKFMEYYSGLVRLTPERAKKRILNSFGMLQRLREEYLIPVFASDNSTVKNKKALSCSELKTEIKFVKGIGPKKAKLMNMLGIENVEDLLRYYPRAYEDRRRIVNISDIIGEEKVTVSGKIVAAKSTRTKSGMWILSASITDETGVLIVNWFNQNYLRNIITEDKSICLTGKVKYGKFAGWEMQSPDFEILEDSEIVQRIIFPVYRVTNGIHVSNIRKAVRNTVKYADCLDNGLPSALESKYELLPVSEAVKGIHFPKSDYHLKKCKTRLVYDEFFFFQLAALYARKITDKKNMGKAKIFKGTLSGELENSLPFKLTSAQKQACNSIREGLKSEYPLNVLLQGDVGSGKTIVALLGMLDSVEAGYQSTIMAPTSILAQQHFENVNNLVKGLNVKTELLISNIPEKDKKEIKARIKNGEVDIVIGTHAIIQDDVDFDNLGMAVIDEQHRFGVKQREKLINKGQKVDTVVMTATPIPRTLALSAYGDLDVVIIDELPPNRQSIKTVLISEKKSKELYDFIKSEIAMGHKAYIVYPLIEESEQMDLKDATSMYEFLKTGPFSGTGVGLLHGKMKAEEKDEIMQDFINGKYSLLVSTTVIEVGIDVPDATVMVIEHPERFGLAQLHQLRGRVGRSHRKSYCFLVTTDTSPESYGRLRYFSETENGFLLADYDLKTRGPGEFMGVRQHGVPNFNLGNIVEDIDILENARKDAKEILESDPGLERHEELKIYLYNNYKDKMSLIDIG